jgi:hypothetical protein
MNQGESTSREEMMGGKGRRKTFGGNRNNTSGGPRKSSYFARSDNSNKRPYEGGRHNRNNKAS